MAGGGSRGKIRVVNKRKIKQGRVVIPADTNPWPHEKRVAKILALAGYCVRFIPEANIKTPDVYLGITAYEIKSPTSNKIDAVERNITKALVKCPNIIFDSSRMKIRDAQIMRELIKRRQAGKGLKKLLFINKLGEIIDIEAHS